MTVDPGSFRDPSARVLLADGRVFRALGAEAAAHIDTLWSSGLRLRLEDDGSIVSSRPIAAHSLPEVVRRAAPPTTTAFLEHERIPFLSYSAEWPFALLKRAALHHLNLHLRLLEAGFTLSDASAYNIQFRGPKPVFIDITSIRPYTEGEYWAGYRQFCEQFLNPLLLAARVGVPYHSWLAGSLEGLAVRDLARLLPLRCRMSPRAWLHVYLHGRLDASPGQTLRGGATRARPLPKPAMVWMLRQLRRWIAALEPHGIGATAWRNYTTSLPYAPEEAAAKSAFVSAYVDRAKPRTVLDIGCNVGTYTAIALGAGAVRSIGFDNDAGALATAVDRATTEGLDFLPLHVDLTDPSTDRGWAQRERAGLASRAEGDGLLALALLHHLVIGRNVDMDAAVDWMMSLAPSGVIEFVPKTDPTVRLMLRDRRDIFPDYHADTFRVAVSRRGRIISEQTVTDSGRLIVAYAR